MSLASAIGFGKSRYLSTFSSLVYNVLPAASVIMLFPSQVLAMASTCFASTFNNMTNFYNLVCDADVVNNKLIPKLNEACVVISGNFCPKTSDLFNQSFASQTLGDKCEIFYNGTKVAGQCVVNFLSEASPFKDNSTEVGVATIASVGVCGLVVVYGLFKYHQRREEQLQAVLDEINATRNESSPLLGV